MRLQNLYQRHPGSEIYLVGTGPSMRVFPWEFLQDKITIGLNQAWRYFTPTYSITVHPELYLDYQKAAQRPKTQWLIKRKPPMDTLELDDPEHYVFHTEENLDVVRQRREDVLYIGRGVQCTALDLACRMGCKTAILIGCDACDLGGDHHGHAQHVRFLGVPPAVVYQEYRKFTAKVRRVVRDTFGMNVLTLTPFVGAGTPGEDYQRLCKEKSLPKLPPAKDTSPYKRARPKL